MCGSKTCFDFIAAAAAAAAASDVAAVAVAAASDIAASLGFQFSKARTRTERFVLGKPTRKETQRRVRLLRSAGKAQLKCQTKTLATESLLAKMKRKSWPRTGFRATPAWPEVEGFGL